MSFADRKNVKDEMTDAFRGIDVEHSNIHSGEFYEAQIDDLVIAPADTASIILDLSGISSGTTVHFRNTWIVNEGINLDYILYEAPTWTASGTASIANHYRGHANVSETVVWDGTVTVSAFGTQVARRKIIGGTAFKGFSGGFISQSNEFVLDNTKKFALSFANTSTATTTVTIAPIWYEED